MVFSVIFLVVGTRLVVGSVAVLVWLAVTEAMMVILMGGRGDDKGTVAGRWVGPSPFRPSSSSDRSAVCWES